MKINRPKFYRGKHQFADKIINSDKAPKQPTPPFFLNIIDQYLSKKKKRKALKQFDLIQHPQMNQLEKNDALTSIKNMLDDQLSKQEVQAMNSFFFERASPSLPYATSPPPYHQEYDLFLSFSEEDVEVATQIYEALTKKEIKVWFSRVHLKTGDSILRVISEAIKRSQYGLIIISPYTFETKKHFPILELHALLNKEMYGHLRGLLPIYHQISHSDIVLDFPMIADHNALSTTAGITSIAEQIGQIIQVD